MPFHTTQCGDSHLTPFAWRPQLQLSMPMGNEHQRRQQLHLQLPTPMPTDDNDDDNSCSCSCQHQQVEHGDSHRDDETRGQAYTVSTPAFLFSSSYINFDYCPHFRFQ